MAMTAMILAAGFGERLRPLTATLPKALVPVNGKPMISYAIETVKRFGCRSVVVNIHHYADLLRKHFAKTDYGIPVTLVEEYEILGTGGAILNAQRHLQNGEQFLLHNADIVSDFELCELIAARKVNGALATLAVNRRETTRGVLFGTGMRFLGKEVWMKDGSPVSPDAQRYGFCGIHVVSTDIFSYDFPQGFSDIFDLYRIAMKRGARLTGYAFDGFWADLGTVERVRAFEESPFGKTRGAVHTR